MIIDYLEREQKLFLQKTLLRTQDRKAVRVPKIIRIIYDLVPLKPYFSKLLFISLFDRNIACLKSASANAPICQKAISLFMKSLGKN